MNHYHQLELLAPPPDPQPDRWLYAMYARYQDRTNALLYIEAESEEQAREIATKQLNRQGKPYRGITCSLGNRRSLDGWECCPTRRDNRFKQPSDKPDLSYTPIRGIVSDRYISFL